MEVGKVDVSGSDGQHFDATNRPTPDSGQRQRIFQPEAYDQPAKTDRVVPSSKPTNRGTGMVGPAGDGYSKRGR